MKKLLALLLLVPGICFSQYPTKPVRIVLPFGPGGIADITTRTIAPQLTDSLGQQVIVENKPGAGGMLGPAGMAKTAATVVARGTDSKDPRIQIETEYRLEPGATWLTVTTERPSGVLHNSRATSPKRFVSFDVRIAHASPLRRVGSSGIIVPSRAIGCPAFPAPWHCKCRRWRLRGRCTT